MAAFPVVGDGPIAFFDGSTGQQILVPLASVQFTNAAGTAVALLPPFAAAPYAAALKGWILYLVSASRLSVGSGPALNLAFVASAADKGSAGDNVKLVIAYSSLTAFDVTASEAETYKGLTVDTIKTVLGTQSTLGTQPGLAHVVDGPIAMPVAAAATTFGSGSSSVPATFAVPAATGSAFTLEARRVGADGNLITATVSDVDTAAGTFTLEVAWSHAVTGVVAADVATLGTKLAPLGFLVSVSPPPSGTFAMPQAVSLTLGGGADPAAAQQNFAAIS